MSIELELDTVYKIADNEQPYSVKYFLLPTVQIIGGAVNVWVSNVKDKPVALTTVAGMSKIENSLDEPFSLSARYRWIGFEPESDTPALFNNGVTADE
ncbi:MAG: hypothetical protein HN929_11505 [Chloroflexi bacterium]|jgi:hypothetical protein|nr:hypothetical protein [Chloroflexota bacterium]